MINYPALNDDTKMLTETNTETFFPMPNFSKPRLFSRPNFPKPILFSETKFSETDTFFRGQILQNQETCLLCTEIYGISVFFLYKEANLFVFRLSQLSSFQRFWVTPAGRKSFSSMIKIFILLPLSHDHHLPYLDHNHSLLHPPPALPSPHLG